MVALQSALRALQPSLRDRLQAMLNGGMPPEELRVILSSGSSVALETAKRAAKYPADAHLLGGTAEETQSGQLQPAGPRGSTASSAHARAPEEAGSA
jgi:hypothetical protein